MPAVQLQVKPMVHSLYEEIITNPSLQADHYTFGIRKFLLSVDGGAVFPCASSLVLSLTFSFFTMNDHDRARRVSSQSMCQCVLWRGG